MPKFATALTLVDQLLQRRRDESTATEPHPTMDPVSSPHEAEAPSASSVVGTVGADEQHSDTLTPRASVDEGRSGPKPAPIRRIDVRDETALTAAADYLAEQPLLGCDLETTGLDPHIDAIRLVTLAARDVESVTGEEVVVAFVVDGRACPDWPAVLGSVIARPDLQTIWHNAKFDLKFLLKDGIIPANVWDTMIAAQLLDGGVHLGQKGVFGLRDLVTRELGVVLDKSLQTSDWTADELTDEQLSYAARDAAVLLDLHACLAASLQADGLDDAAALEMTTVPAVAWLEWVGTPFDADAWQRLSEEAMTRKLALEEEVRAALSEAWGSIRPAGCRQSPINLDAPAQVKKALRALGLQVDGTDEETLAALADRHPVIPMLLAYREAAKRASTYGIDFLTHVHPSTRRIHADYRQIGAATGRMSCSRPGLQQIPRAPAYRRCFRPAEGRVVVKVDLSTIELCVAAELAGDEGMIAAIAKGQDLHRLTAAALFDKPPEAVTKDERAFGKTVNFGTLYGQGLAGLRQNALKHGLDLSPDEARQFQARFRQAWPHLAAWQSRQMRSRCREVRTASKRIRRLSPTARGTVRANTPIQGTAADGFKAALARLWQTRSRYPSAVPILAVHDELVMECDAADARGVAAWVTECLQRGMQRYLTRVPVRVEAVIAANWSGDTD